jgi:hypothetical protein
MNTFSSNFFPLYENKNNNMKKRLPILVLLVLSMICLFLSCGRWSDNIKLSTRTAVFKAKGDSIVITTKGDWWWLSDVTVDTRKYYNFQNVDVFADCYIVKQDCFTFERRDKNTLFIKLDPNPSSKSRFVVFNLEAGDYFDRVTIKQNPQ